MRHKAASRHVEAFEFSSPEELKRYLKDHPEADRAKHTVKKQKPTGKQPPPKGEHEPAPAEGKAQEPGAKKKPPPLPPQKAAPQEQGGHEPEAEGKPKGSILKRLQGLSSGAMAAFKAAPAGAKKFFEDEGHRKAVLGKIGKAILGAPKEYKTKLIETAKHEVQEFKLAGQGIKTAFSGKPLSEKQKAAIKKVAIHMGITLAAASMGATGIAAGLGATASAMAKHIALKAATKSLGHLHMFQEAGHVGHGLLDLLSKFAADGKHNPDDVMAALVMQSVQDVLAEMDDDGLKSILEYMGKAKPSGGTQPEQDEDTEEEAPEADSEEPAPKDESGPPPDDSEEPPPPKAKKVKTAAGQGLADLCEQAETVHKGLRSWIREFPQVLAKAQQEAVGLAEGLVWQDRLVDYWRDLDGPMRVLEAIDDRIEFYPSGGKLRVTYLINEARQVTWERGWPVKARIEYGFGKPQFIDNRIAYFVARLEEWADAFEKWNEESIQTLHQVARKAGRLV